MIKERDIHKTELKYTSLSSIKNAPLDDEISSRLKKAITVVKYCEEYLVTRIHRLALN